MVDAKGFFIGTCQYNFGTSPHAQCALVGIQCFSREFLALLQYEFIQIGQDGGVKADAVFHQQDELHTHFVDVVLQVHLVLYQLDDGNQQVGVSQPAEHILKGTEVFIGNTLGDAVAERGKYHHRNLFIQVLMYRATSKLSLSPVPGMQMMRSKEMEDSCVSASSQVETCVKRGG